MGKKLPATQGHSLASESCRQSLLRGERVSPDPKTAPSPPYPLALLKSMPEMLSPKVPCNDASVSDASSITDCLACGRLSLVQTTTPTRPPSLRGRWGDARFMATSPSGFLGIPEKPALEVSYLCSSPKWFNHCCSTIFQADPKYICSRRVSLH